MGAKEKEDEVGLLSHSHHGHSHHNHGHKHKKGLFGGFHSHHSHSHGDDECEEEEVGLGPKDIALDTADPE
ncbi:hypothetical protein HDU76_012438, partial [Blyttiomyces sp. JEL0837]